MPDQMHDCAPASTHVRCGGWRGERRGGGRRATSTHTLLIWSSILALLVYYIEASLDYYTNKNIILRPAKRQTCRLSWTYIGLHHSMHAHFSKPVNALDPDEAECRLQFQRKPRCINCCSGCRPWPLWANLVGLQLQTSFRVSMKA